MAICATLGDDKKVSQRQKKHKSFIFRGRITEALFCFICINNTTGAQRVSIFTPVLLLFMGRACSGYATGLFEIFGNGNNLEVAALNELDDLGALGRVVNVGFNAL